MAWLRVLRQRKFLVDAGNFRSESQVKTRIGAKHHLGCLHSEQVL